MQNFPFNGIEILSAGNLVLAARGEEIELSVRKIFGVGYAHVTALGGKRNEARYILARVVNYAVFRLRNFVRGYLSYYFIVRAGLQKVLRFGLGNDGERYLFLFVGTLENFIVIKREVLYFAEKQVVFGNKAACGNLASIGVKLLGYAVKRNPDRIAQKQAVAEFRVAFHVSSRLTVEAVAEHYSHGVFALFEIPGNIRFVIVNRVRSFIRERVEKIRKIPVEVVRKNGFEKFLTHAGTVDEQLVISQPADVYFDRGEILYAYRFINNGRLNERLTGQPLSFFRKHNLSPY